MVLEGICTNLGAVRLLAVDVQPYGMAAKTFLVLGPPLFLHFVVISNRING